MNDNFNFNGTFSKKNNEYSQSSYYPSREIESAFSIILDELRNKDQKIKELEEKVEFLTLKIREYENINANNNLLISSPLLSYENEDIPPSNYQNYSPSSISNDPYLFSYNSDSEGKIMVVKPLLNKPETPTSSFVATSKEIAKQEVKNYLKEVKSRIDPKNFKVFLKYIKDLSKKENVNKRDTIQNIKQIFGSEHADLFNKFEEILVKKK